MTSGSCKRILQPLRCSLASSPESQEPTHDSLATEAAVSARHASSRDPARTRGPSPLADPGRRGRRRAKAGGRSAGSRWGARPRTATSRRLQLERDDGELTVVTVDEETESRRSGKTLDLSILNRRTAGTGVIERRKSIMVIYNYIFVGLLLLVAIVFALAPLFIEFLVAPRKRTLAKGDAYECGVKTYGETWVRFRIQYYIYAIMFVVFDIETVFLFPWAVELCEFGLGLFRALRDGRLPADSAGRAGLRLGQGGAAVGLMRRRRFRSWVIFAQDQAVELTLGRRGFAGSRGLRSGSSACSRASWPTWSGSSGRWPRGSRTGSGPTGSGRWACCSRSPTRSS